MATTTKNMQVVAGNASANVTAQVTDSMPGIPSPGPAGYKYTGLRYVPVFADPIEWSSENSYEALTVVMHEGNSYTSKQAVPVGIDIQNETFWVKTFDFNAQLAEVSSALKLLEDDVNELDKDVKSLPTILTPEQYGAVGDGTTDDTAAFVAMFNAGKQMETTVNNENVTPAFVLTKNYKIGIINIPNINYTNIIGLGCMIQGGGFYFPTDSSWRANIEGITFVSSNNPIYFDTRNLEYGKIIISKCIFYSCTGVAITIKRRSVNSFIEKCTFRGCTKSILVVDNDHCKISDNWFECNTLWEDKHCDIEQQAPNEGFLEVTGNFFIPGIAQTALEPTWIKIGRSANITNNRFSGENSTIHTIKLDYDNYQSFNFNSTVYPIVNFSQNPIVAGVPAILFGNFRGRLNVKDNSGWPNGFRLALLADGADYSSVPENYLFISFDGNTGRTFNFNNGQYDNIAAAFKPSLPVELKKYVVDNKEYSNAFNGPENYVTLEGDGWFKTANVVINNAKDNIVVLKGVANTAPPNPYNEPVLLMVSYMTALVDSAIVYKPYVEFLNPNPSNIAFTVKINGEDTIPTLTYPFTISVTPADNDGVMWSSITSLPFKPISNDITN